MRLVVLGAPRPPTVNAWKDDLCEGADALGWSVVHLPARDVTADDVVRACRSADVMCWARTHGHRPAGLVADTLRRVEDAGTVTVGLHLDLYWGIRRREAEIGVDPWWSCQWVFTADGGPRDWASRGVNHRWCPPPVGARWLGRAAPHVRWGCDAVFVGRWVPTIHGQHRRDLLAWARRRWGSRFLHVDGRTWRAWGAELSTLYASAGVAVGDSAEAPAYWSDRVVNTLGRGGLLAHPYVPGMTEQGFTDDTLVTYPRGRFDVLAAKLDALDPADRRRITDNALDLIAGRHTWPVRLQQIFGVVFGGGRAGVAQPGVRMAAAE